MEKEQFIELLMKKGFTYATEENGIVMVRIDGMEKEGNAALAKIKELAKENEFRCSYGVRFKNNIDKAQYNKEETASKEEIEEKADYDFLQEDALDGFGQLSFI